jgi:uncharacterized damage-inducible protein DinB
MHPLETVASLLEWAARNTAYNLEFIPADRLDWKPAPAAKSAYEIIQHVCAAIGGMQPVLEGASEWAPSEEPLPTSLAEAQQQLLSRCEAYAAALRQVPASDLSRTITIAGTFHMPLARAASMATVDLIHHHGQIAYLQTLLGDEEFHFVPEA